MAMAEDDARARVYRLERAPFTGLRGWLDEVGLLGRAAAGVQGPRRARREPEADVSGALPGDQATVTVLVKVPQARAFQVFTEEIDAWWRTGLRFRVSGRRPGVLCLEPKVGGRLFETVQSAAGARVVETGRVTTWEPPGRLVFEWRATNFAPSERTEVEVLFEPSASGTQVTVKHRGWSQIRPDHPARHGLEVAPFLRMMGLWWGDLLTSLREHAAGNGLPPKGGS